MPEIIYRSDALGPRRLTRRGADALAAAGPLAGAIAQLWRKDPAVAKLAAVCVGGCADAIGTDRLGMFRASAHAHTAGDSNRGTVCFRSRKPERLVTAAGNPTRLLIHEVAHIATSAGHTAAWRAMVSRLGAPSEAKRYEARTAARKARPPATWFWHDPASGEQRSGTYREMREATR